MTETRKWGLTLANDPHPEGDRAQAELAERVGFTDLWNAEVSAADGVTTLTAAALSTSQVRLGTAVLNVFSRTPYLMAMTATSLQHLSNGRFCLGLGTSSHKIVEDWHGAAFERPLRRVRNYVAAVRALLAGDRVTMDGSVRLARARLTMNPPQPVPIYLAALGPAMLRLVGEVGDGAILNFITTSHLEWMREQLAEGAERSAEGNEPEVVVRLFLPYPGDDVAAIDSLRDVFAEYATVPVYQRLLESIGFDSQVRAAMEAREARDRTAARRAVDDDMLEALAIVGNVEEQRARIDEFVRAGTDVPVLTFFTSETSPVARRELVQEAIRRYRPNPSDEGPR